jgi:methane monooxygenase component A beta chain/propane monooxygenase small subunit
MIRHSPTRPALPGNRFFTWYTPAGKSPTEYEDLTVGQQSTPAQFAFQGWPIRFDDGRDPYSADTTAIRSRDWYAYRDPNRTMQRAYVSSTNESEKSLERSIAGAKAAGLFELANPEWVRTGLAQHYMTYPFVEYGLFLANCYAEREALSDTVTFSIVFSAADKLRHLQDIVYYSFDLAEAFDDFDDGAVMASWKSDPIWQGARRAVESIIALEDWMEVVVASHLCLDRIFGELAKVEYFSRFAAANGDVVTPILIASSEADTARTQRWMRALMLHVLDDQDYGKANREIIQGWVDDWSLRAEQAAVDFRGAFESAPIAPTAYSDAAQRVRAKQHQALEELGLRPARRRRKGVNG